MMTELYAVDNRILEKVVHLLYKMAAGVVPDRDFGICGVIHNGINDSGIGDHRDADTVISIMRWVWMEWPEYSGQPSYPVSCGDIGPMEAFSSNVSLWNGEYGLARRRLAHFLARKFEMFTKWSQYKNSKQGIVEYLETMHEKLCTLRDQIKNDPKLYGNVGLCKLIFDNGGISFYNNLMDLWPKHSGLNLYPVPPSQSSIDRGVHPRSEFIVAASSHDLYVGEYGAMRMELLDWLIDQTSKWSMIFVKGM